MSQLWCRETCLDSAISHFTSELPEACCISRARPIMLDLRHPVQFITERALWVIIKVEGMRKLDCTAVICLP